MLGTGISRMSSRRERGTLGGILDVDLIRGSDNLHLLVELLGVVKSEDDVVEPGMEGNLLAREEERSLPCEPPLCSRQEEGRGK